MKPHIWKSSYYKRIFQIISISTFGILFVTLISLYISFYYTTTRYLDSINQHFMSNVASNILFQSNRSQENALNAALSYSGTSLLSAQEPSEDVRVRSLKNLDYNISQDTLIHSVYLLNATTNRVSMLGSDLSYNDADLFSDTDTLRHMLAAKRTENPPFAHTISNSSYHSSSHSYVYTYIYRLSNKNVIAINLYMDDLFGILKTNPSAYNATQSNFLVFSPQNEPLYASVSSKPLVGLGADAVGELLNKNAGNTSFSATLNHSRFLINTYQDPSSALTFVSIIEQADIYKSFYYQQILFVFIVIIVGLLTLFINIKVSKTFYSPIGKMQSLLAPQGKTLPLQTDEIAFITQSIIDTAQSLETLHEYKSNTLTISQTSLIKQQLLYGTYPDDEFLQKCQQQELTYQIGSQSILIYARWYSTGHSDAIQSSDQALLSYAISNVFHELVESTSRIQDISFENEGMAFWCHFKQMPPEEEMRKIMQGLQSTFKQYFELHLSFFVSGVIQKPSQLHPTMQQLEELSHYQYFYTEGCILYPHDLDINSLKSELCPLPSLTALEKDIRTSKWEQCRQLLIPFFTELPKYSYEAATASLNMLTSKLITLFKKIAANHPGHSAISYHTFFRDVMAAPALTLAQDKIEQQLKAITESFASPHNQTINLLADDVQRYLEENYQDFNLSSKSIALHHHISVPYLNRIFKQKTGETIAFYIKSLRLNHARQMLTSTNLSVESIAKKVGFENTKYFYTVFKNEYGLSPSNYRITHSINTTQTPQN